MSDTAVAQPTAEPGLADALDAGIDALDKQPSQPVAQETPESVKTPEASKEPVITKTNTASAEDPLDILTKRLTGKEDTTVSKTSTDDLDIKTPENLKPEAQTAWARLTKDLRDARAKIKEFETKASQTPTDSVEQLDLKAQLEMLRNERDEYEAELKLSRLESTREYKQAVIEPLNSIQKEVADICSLYETDPRLIYSAMVESDPVKRRGLLKEATANFDPVDSLALRNKAEELQKVFSRRDLLTKDVSTVLEMLDNDARTEQEVFEKRAMEELTQAYQSEWEAMQKENPLLRPIENNEAWNNTLQLIQTKAMEIENTDLDPRSKARLTFNAAAMPVLMHLFQDYVSKTQTRIQDLEKTAKELRATLPSSGADTGSAAEIASDLGFLEALERGMK